MLALAEIPRLAAQQVQPVSDDAFRAIAYLFAYDRTLPLAPRILEHADSAIFTREKIVINGWRGSRVPLLLATPRDGQRTHPIVVMIDGIGGWKERWWQRDSWNRGRIVIDSLLGHGFAVVMADAPYSGERKAEGDYQDPYTMIGTDAQLRDLLQQATIEHRRIIDYISTRADIDSTRVSLLGLSMGGMITFYLAALEPRVRSAVAGLTPLKNIPDLLWPGHFAPRARAPVLMLMGRTDSWYDVPTGERVQASIPSAKRLVWYEAGHRLPEEYAGEVLRWLRR